MYIQKQQVKRELTAKKIEMEKPYEFTDVMVKGAFCSFTHTHEFIESDTGTIMKDTFSYKSPFCIFGVMADRLFLEKYMKGFIVNLAKELIRIAEKSTEATSLFFLRKINNKK